MPLLEAAGPSCRCGQYDFHTTKVLPLKVVEVGRRCVGATFKRPDAALESVLGPAVRESEHTMLRGIMIV